MPPKTIQVSEDLANQIKARRAELGLSIEEAASRAGIGAKTWGKYESGQSIRSDKATAVCKVLKWKNFPDDSAAETINEATTKESLAIDSSHAAWSQFLKDEYGYKGAASFAFGTDILLDYINKDLEDLSHLPKGTHVGQLPDSWMIGLLPPQYLMQYNYDFLFKLRADLISYRIRAKHEQDIMAHTVAQELLVRLIRDASFELVSDWETDETDLDEDGYPRDLGWDEWPEDICGDDDLKFFINDDTWTEEGNSYSFENWFEPQFCLS